MVFTQSDVYQQIHFFVSEHVNHHNVHSKNPHTTCKHICNSPKLNVWCVFMHNKVISPFSLHLLCLEEMNRSWKAHKLPQMFLSARLAGSCQPLREYRLYLYGDKWAKMLLHAQLSALSHHTQRLPKKPYPICVFLSEIDQHSFRSS